MKPPDNFQWRYLLGGSRIHALQHSGARRAVCGAQTWLNGNWFGTGTPDEYEQAAKLPHCHNCLRMIEERL